MFDATTMSADAYTAEQNLSYYNNNLSNSGDFDILDFLSGDEENESEQTIQNITITNEPTNMTSAIFKEDPDLQQAIKEAEEEEEEMPSLTLSITNVVAMANMRCHLRLKDIAKLSVNVEYKELQNHVIMRLRKPYTVATIWSSGKIWCTGANSLNKARVGARKIARRISKCGFSCKFSNFRVVNIMATTKLPFRVRLDKLVDEAPRNMNYEPELAPGLNFKIDIHGSTSLKLFATGRMVIMGQSMEAIQDIVAALVPLAARHQTDEPVSDEEDEYYYRSGSKHRNKSNRNKRKRKTNVSSEDELSDSEWDSKAKTKDESEAHMKNWSSRRALKDARKTTLPQLPKEVIAAELDEDYFVEYDDEDNSDLEDDIAVGDDSDAEEQAIMRQRIMRGDNLDDYDSSSGEEGNGLSAADRKTSRQYMNEVQNMSSEEDEDEEDSVLKKVTKQEPGTSYSTNGSSKNLNYDLHKVRSLSQAIERKNLERKPFQHTRHVGLRPPPFTPKFRVFNADTIRQKAILPTNSLRDLNNTIRKEPSGSSHKFAKIVSFDEKTSSQTLINQSNGPIKLGSVTNNITRFVSAPTPSILVSYNRRAEEIDKELSFSITNMLASKFQAINKIILAHLRNLYYSDKKNVWKFKNPQFEKGPITFSSTSNSPIPIQQNTTNIRKITTCPGPVLRVIAPLSSQQSRPLSTPSVISSLQTAQPLTKFITVNRFPNQIISNPAIIQVPNSAVVNSMSQVQIVRTAGSMTNAPMVVIRPRVSKPPI